MHEERERETLQQNNRPPTAPILPCVAHPSPLFETGSHEQLTPVSTDGAELPTLLSPPPVQDYSCATTPGYSFKSSLELSQPPDYPESVLPVFRGCLIILSCSPRELPISSLLSFLSHWTRNKDALVISTVSRSRITHYVLNKHLVKGKESN